MADQPASRGERQSWLGSPLIVHRCLRCQRLFDSPSICMEDGTETVPIVRPIKIVLWKHLPDGQPMGTGLDHEDADVVVSVDFETGSATVYPIVNGSAAQGGYSVSGPPATSGLDLVVVVERRPADA